ncbi:MAG: 8-amino-7-oxononanoate synthase [Gammaproteobacteria bacterium]
MSKHGFDLAADLAARRAAGLYRVRGVQAAPCGATAVVDGRELLNFCSNDYLGLANHPGVVAALKRGADEYGAGSGASHLVTGHTRAHHELEEALAAFTGRPRALLFSTGYMANLGAVSALCGDQDAVFEDRLNHASLLDAGLLTGARFQRYLHNDAANLEARLAKSVARRRLVITDGVFSMDGDVAPLRELARVSTAHGGWLMVDDAHGIGVLGRGGRGCVDAAGLGIGEVPVLVGTLGKAFGTFGAFVAGSEELVEYLVQFARPYIYTTALPPAVATATLAALRLLEAGDDRRALLREHIARFRTGARQLGYELMDSATPIQPILVGDAQAATDFSAALRAAGILVTAIRPPTVPAGSARLRVTFSASHSTAQVDALLAALEQLAPRFAASSPGATR